MTTVLILGGYGTFGGRLARLLCDASRLRLLIAGRARDKAAAFCAVFSGTAKVEPLVFDRDGDVEAQLRQAAPDIVVDATGPFQIYGDMYRVVRACLALGIDYLDLADSSDFVQGIGAFDAEAKAQGIFILSGVSSFPVLTVAVVRHLSADMSRLDAVSGGIAPSPYAGVGLNVVRAIASYAGKPVGARYAMIDVRRYTIAPPGQLPLHPIRFSLVDVPDLQALPALWPSLRSVWMGAGPVPEILHRLLNVLAQTVRWRLLSSLVPFAPLMYRAINVLRWGEHRGGMFVAIEGVTTDGQRIERSWHMVAEGDDGPLIPSMALEAIIRRCVDGSKPAPGARGCVAELELSDYLDLFSRRRIVCGVRDAMPAATPLYQRLLGDAWSALPTAIREMHDLHDRFSATGIATVERGTGLLSRLVAAAMGFPQAGQDVPVRVDFERRGRGEIWRREFAGKSFSSTQDEGQGSFGRLLCEQFGPFAFGLALVLDGKKLRLVVRCWSAFGVPLPLALAPRGEAFESAEDDRFNFHVEIGLPLIGLIVRYRGWLKRQ